MPLKWKLFGIANYILLLFSLFTFVFALKAFFNPENGMRYLKGARLLTACYFVMVMNATFNIYTFHKHLPSQPLSKIFKRIYGISNILCCISISIVFYYSLPEVFVLNDEEAGLFIFLGDLMLLLTAFVLAGQFTLPKYIEKQFKRRLVDQLDDIGEKSNQYPL